MDCSAAIALPPRKRISIDNIIGHMLKRDHSDDEICEECESLGFSRREITEAIDRQRRNLLSESHLHLALQIARYYWNSEIAEEDLFQEGCEGIANAAIMFRPELGFQFSTYSVYHIRACVWRAIKSLRKRIPTVSLDGDLYDDGRCMKHDITADNSPSPEDIYIQHQQAAPALRAMEQLPAKERQVLRWRFGFETGSPETLRYVSKKMGISYERVRQIEKAGVNHLRTKLKCQ